MKKMNDEELLELATIFGKILRELSEKEDRKR